MHKNFFQEKIPVASILCIGTELTEGHIRDDNGYNLAGALSNLGFLVNSIEFLPDSDSLSSNIKQKAEVSDLLIIAGGLGPTSDDKTRRAVAHAADVELEYHPEIWNLIIKRYGKHISDNNKNQAYFPYGFNIFPNRCGSAAGFYGKIGLTFCVAFPGPPREIASMLDDGIKIITSNFKLKPIGLLICSIWLVSESKLEELLTELKLPDGVSWGTRTADGRVILYIRGNNSKALNKFYELIKVKFGSLLFQEGESGPASGVLSLLRDSKKTLCGAESCSGGMISQYLTDVPGSSAVFKGAVVTYWSDIKESLLGVSSKTIKEFSVVSTEVVSEMVDKSLVLFSSDYSYAISGVAGPACGEDGKAVGTVVIGVASSDGRKFIKTFLFKGNREEIRKKSSATALFLLENFISSPSSLDNPNNWAYSYAIFQTKLD